MKYLSNRGLDSVVANFATTESKILNLRGSHDLLKYDMRKGDIPVVGFNGIMGYHDTTTSIKS